MYSSGAKYKEHCCNISRDICDGVLYCFSGTSNDVVTSLTCVIQKRNISENKKKDILKRKTLVRLKLSIGRLYFCFRAERHRVNNYIPVNYLL